MFVFPLFSFPQVYNAVWLSSILWTVWRRLRLGERCCLQSLPGRCHINMQVDVVNKILFRHHIQSASFQSEWVGNLQQ